MVQILTSIMWIMHNQAKYLVDEWAIIFDIFEIIVKTKSASNKNTLLELINEILSIIRVLTIKKCYNGSTEEIIRLYKNIKIIITDANFDSYYLTLYLKKTPEELGEALINFLDFHKIIVTLLNFEESNKRIHMLINAFFDVYLHLAEGSYREQMEIVFMKKINEFSNDKLVISLANTYLLFKIMETMSKRLSTENFIYMVNNIKSEILTPSSVSKGTKDYNYFVIELVRLLFTLFKESYTIYPARRLGKVLHTFIEIYNELNKNTTPEMEKIRLEFLIFFGNIEYDYNYNLRLHSCNTSSNLSLIKELNDCFSPQPILDIAFYIIDNNIDSYLVIFGLNILLSLIKSPYIIDAIDIMPIIIRISQINARYTDYELLDKAKLEILRKTTKILQFITMKRDPKVYQTLGFGVSAEEVKKILIIHLEALNNLLDKFKKKRNTILDVESIVYIIYREPNQKQEIPR